MRIRSRSLARVVLALSLTGGLGVLSQLPESAGSAATTPALSAVFAASSTWSGGYAGNFTITNQSTSTVNAWTLGFTLPAGSTITSSWNGTLTQSGTAVTVTNASWDGTLAPNQTATFGLDVSYSGAFTPLSSCSINGSASTCTIQAFTSGAGSSSGSSGSGSSGSGSTGSGSTGSGSTGSGSSGSGSSGSGSTGSGSTGSGSTGSGSGTTSTGVTAAMAVSSTWSGGYDAAFTVTNKGKTAVSTWSLSFTLPSGVALGSLWNGTDTVSGQVVSVTPLSWNAALAPGASATIGFEIDDSALYPTSCSINGSTSSCTVPTSTAVATCTKLPGTAGPVPFAPYADVTLFPQISLTNTACQTGIRNFTLAFFTGPASGTGCTPELAGATYENPSLLADINQLRSLGGNVIGSFGGESGQELAQTCTSASQLEAAYQSVISYYGLTSIDFDVEGAAVDDTAANQLRSTALAALQASDAAAGHPISISLTLPVLPQGLPAAELSVVQSAATAGVNVSVVNLMAMDFGDGPAPSPSGQMGTYAIDSAQATEAQLATIYPKDTAAQLWSMIGVTPMIGQNDAPDEVFTTTDASKLATWAKTQGIGRLAMWSVARDNECSGGADEAVATCSGVVQTPWAFSNIFLAS